MASKGLGICRNFKGIGKSISHACKQWRHHAGYCTTAGGLSHSQIGDILSKIEGGSVDLHTNNETGIATVLMNYPSKRNAFSGKMMVDFNNCVQELELWKDGQGVILCGAGGTFCSGGDIELVHRSMQDVKLGHYFSQYMHNVTARLSKLPLVSVAAIDGHAIGGGAELCTACDFRVISSKAKIGFVQVKLNILPGFGGATRLVRLIGQAGALKILTSGAVMNANTAYQLGLVNHVMEQQGDMAAQAKQWLLSNLGGDKSATQRIKQIVSMAAEVDMLKALDFERQLFREVWGQEAHRKALNENMKHRD